MFNFNKTWIIVFILLCLFVDTSIWMTENIKEVEKDYIQVVNENEKLSNQLALNEESYRDTLDNIIISLYEREKFQIGGIDISDVKSKDIDALIEAIKNRTTDFNEYLHNTENFFNLRAQSQKTIPSIFPVAYHTNVRITDPYGLRYYPLNNTLLFHRGIDISGDVGSEIIATADGIISQQWFHHPVYGRMLEIDHGNGFKTKYAHLRYIYVDFQQEVKQGEPIGVMGNSGKSAGRHLHYEVIYQGQHTNPIDFLNSVTIAN